MTLTSAHRDLQACLDDLLAAKQVAEWAADQLADVICFCHRLCTVVEGDVRTAAAEGVTR
jgi:hypothetical protein